MSGREAGPCGIIPRGIDCTFGGKEPAALPVKPGATRRRHGLVTVSAAKPSAAEGVTRVDRSEGPWRPPGREGLRA